MNLNVDRQGGCTQHFGTPLGIPSRGVFVMEVRTWPPYPKDVFLNAYSNLTLITKLSEYIFENYSNRGEMS